MIELVFFGLVGMLTLVAIVNWRLGIYLAILIDVIRDPIRKISDSHSVLITVVGTLVWIGVLMGAFNSDGREIWSLLRRYRRMGTALTCLVFALVPGAALSMVLYTGGYKLVAIGLISYLGPMVGIAVGFLVPVSEKDIYRLFRFYAITNGIALVGTWLEVSGVDHAVLGGIEMDWERHRHGYVVQLIAGIYRSPDIMGLHAAHMIVFSMMLGLRARGPERLGWIAMILWGLRCVLWSGRRKMIGIPLVFLATYFGLGIWRGSREASRLATLGVLLAIGGTVGLFMLKDEIGSSEYTQYAATLFTEGGVRAKELIGDSIIVTLYQSGALGSGIGSATQGSHYVAVERDKAWQEDGVSRLFKELGVPGVILMAGFLILMGRTVYEALNLIPPQNPLALKQLGVLGIVAGNAASFAMSHQQYSGDPGSAILAVMMLGMVLGIPRIYFREKADFQRRLERQREQQAAQERAVVSIAG